MPTLSDRLLNIWLHSAVPSSLDEMEAYRNALNQVGNFATALDHLKWPGADGLHDWCDNAPRIWLNKRRETVLESTRLQLSMGTFVLNLWLAFDILHSDFITGPIYQLARHSWSFKTKDLKAWQFGKS